MSDTSRMRSIVWSELCHACYWEQYISSYLGYKYDFNKLYSIATIVLSSLSAFFVTLSKEDYSWSMWTGVACIVAVPIIQIVNSSQKHVMMDVDTASSLLKLRSMYLSYYNDLARLFLDIDDMHLNNEQIKTRYFELRKSAIEIDRLKDSLNVCKLKKIDKHAMKQMEIRLAHKFNAQTSL